jgi:hypothetical protein
MRRKTKDRLILWGFALVYGTAFAAMAASRWVEPNWLVFTLKTIGWTVFAFFLSVNVFVLFSIRNRYAEQRPRGLGSFPNPLPNHDSEKRVP